MDKKSIEKMTAAQKKAQTRFKAAVAEAKKLRKKNPKLSQPEALKQAFAIEYKKERSGKRIAGPAKKAAKKAAPKKAAPKKAAKKCAPKKAARKTAKPGERHTDTKSHNVNIRVLSGAGKEYDEIHDMRMISMLNDAIKSHYLRLSRLEYNYTYYEKLMKENPRLNIGTKASITKEIAFWKDQIKEGEDLIKKYQDRINKYRKFTYK